MPTTRPPARLERSYLLLLSFLLILNASNYLPWQPKWLVKVFILISSLIEPELCSNLHIRLAHHCPKVVFFFFCCHCLFCFSFFFFYLFTTNAHNLKNLPFFFYLLINFSAKTRNSHVMDLMYTDTWLSTGNSFITIHNVILSQKSFTMHSSYKLTSFIPVKLVIHTIGQFCQYRINSWPRGNRFLPDV